MRRLSSGVVKKGFERIGIQYSTQKDLSLPRKFVLKMFRTKSRVFPPILFFAILTLYTVELFVCLQFIELNNIVQNQLYILFKKDDAFCLLKIFCYYMYCEKNPMIIIRLI